MRRDIIDGFGGFGGEVVDRALHAALQRLTIATWAGGEAGAGAVQIAAHRVAQVVVEHAHSQALLRTLREVDGTATGPRLAVQRDVAADRQQFLADAAHGLGLRGAQQVEAESVHLVVLQPVLQAVHDVLAGHRVFIGEGVAHARVVQQRAIRRGAEVVEGHGLIEGRVFARAAGVVVDHIHHHADVVGVQRLDGLLQFLRRLQRIDRAGGVVRLGHVEERGPVAPVVFLGSGGEILDGQQMHGGHAQILEVRQAARRLAARGIVRVHKAEVGAALFGRARFVGHGEIAHVHLVQHLVGGLSQCGRCGGVPSLGIHAIKIGDHGECAVGRGGDAMDVRHLARLPVAVEAVAVPRAVQVAIHRRAPQALRASLQLTDARGLVGSSLVQQQIHAFAHGTPCGERGALCGATRAQHGIQRREACVVEHIARDHGLRLHSGQPHLQPRDVGGRHGLRQRHGVQRAAAGSFLRGCHARNLHLRLLLTATRDLQAPEQVIAQRLCARQRDTGGGIQECASQSHGQIDRAGVGVHRRVAADQPHFLHIGIRERDGAILITVLRLPVALAHDEAGACRRGRERHHRIAAECIAAAERELRALAILRPAPEIPAGVVAVRASVMHHQQRGGLRFLATLRRRHAREGVRLGRCSEARRGGQKQQQGGERA